MLKSNVSAVDPKTRKRLCTCPGWGDTHLGYFIQLTKKHNMKGTDVAFPVHDPLEKHLYPGFTKREYMVIEFTKAILTGIWAHRTREVPSDGTIVEWAGQMADKIIKTV